MSLTDTQIRKTRPATKPKKLFDGRGLFLLLNPDGSRWWRFKYRMDGKEKQLSFGTYPDVTLKDAREKCDKARNLVANHIDPGKHRKAVKLAKAESASNSFEVIAREWFEKDSTPWVKSHAKRVIRRLEADFFPWIGKRPIADITSKELLAVFRKIEGRDANETAHRALGECGRIFNYAIRTSRATNDPTLSLKGALAPAEERHYPSITDPEKIGALLNNLDIYQGSFITKHALRLSPFVFLRPGELRRGEWSEISFDKAEWRIVAERMKMRVMHIVPLSSQAIAILRELHALTGAKKYMFPGARTNDRPMSENTVNAALRRLGYTKDEMTGHGFRSMASTRLNELGHNRDAIERQLAHAERNAVRAAYNYAEYLPERRIMMQAWANYLDSLRGNVVSIRRHA